MYRGRACQLFVTETLLVEGAVFEDGTDDAGQDAWVRVGDRAVLDIDGAEDVIDTPLVIRVIAELADQTWSDERPNQVVDVE